MHAGSKGVLAGQVGPKSNTTKHETGNSQKVGGRKTRAVRGAKVAELQRWHQNT